MPVATSARKDFPVPYGLVFVFAILAVAILLAGYFTFREYEKKDRASAERQLSGIADLKVDELVHWRLERFADAEMIYGNASFAKLARRYFADPQDSEAGQQIGDLLEEYSEHYEYNQVRLLDRQSVTLMSFPPKLPPASAAVVQQIPEVLQSGRVTIDDLYRHDYDHHIYLSVLIPIRDASAAKGMIGVVALRVDPAKFLFPHILRWPSPSETAETLLVRREGDEVVYLNETKFQKSAALSRRLPLTRLENPAVLAVLGRTGIVEGVDYQGQPVIADVRSVPDSPWFLVTMMHTSEVYAPAKGQLWIIAGFMAALLLATGAGLAFVWHQQNSAFYRTRYQAAEALRKSEEKFRVLFESAKDGIFQLAANGDVVALNESFARMHGYTVAEMQAMNLKDLDVPESARLAPARLQRLFAGEALSFEVEHYCKNGQTLPLEVSANMVVIGAEKYILGFHRDISERKRAEEALRFSEERFKSLVSTSQEWIWAIDAAGRHTFSNPAIEKILGYHPAEIIEHEALHLLHEQDLPKARQLLGRCMEEKTGWSNFVLRWRHKDGTWRYLESNAVPILDSTGVLLGFRGSDRDITERREAEEKLRKSERKYRNLFDSATDGIFIIGLDGNFIDVNRTAHTRLGYSKEEMLALHISELDPPEFARLVPERQAQIRTYGGAVFESAHRRKDGSVMPVEINSRLIEYDGRQVYFSVIRDISARQEAEEEIRRNEQFIRSILDTVDEGFLVIDPNYRILTVNKAYCDTLALSSDAVIGRHCYEISHRTSRPCYEDGEECAVREVFATGKPHTSLHKHPGPDGQVIYVETKAFPVKDASGAVISAIETINNITEKHLLEEERLKTQKLESIGTLAGGIAHDFNNLLQGVFGYISMAKMTFDRKEKSLAMLEQAEKALHMTVNLTTQLLTFSKGGKPVKKVIGLSLPLENAVKFALSGSQTDYQLDVAPDLWPVEADEGQLAQVIQNIVLNANQAMAGRDTVFVAAANEDIPVAANPRLPQGGRFIRLDIRDSGTGISEQNMLKIFDPYFTTKQQGSGLGLATSYSIIKNHGGVIEVHSELHKGTTFTIYLPAAGADNREAAHTASEALPATQGRRILLMDDEALVRSVAAEMIEALGHVLVCADDGDMAIELFLKARESGKPFDLLILDLTVKGGMGGEEALRKIREIDPGVKAIVSSGYADNQVVAHFRDYGFAAFLNKPYKLAALQECLSSLLV